MKKLQTLALASIALAVFAGLGVAQQKSPRTSGEIKPAPRNQTAPQEATIMEGSRINSSERMATSPEDRAETSTVATGNALLFLAGLNLSVSGGGASPGGQAIVNVSWTGTSGHTYKLCWKRSNQSGDECNHNKIVDIDASDKTVSIGSSSSWSTSVYTNCATGYNFKLKREGSLTNYKKDYTTQPCSGSSNTGSVETAWDSGERQTQIGDKNKNKRKLVMRVWYTSVQKSNGSYDWSVRYTVKAENHNKLGSGWHQVNELSTFTFQAVVELPNGVATINESKDLVGLSSPYSGYLIYNTAGLPVFKSKTATATRSGGPSGLSITWP